MFDYLDGATNHNQKWATKVRGESPSQSIREGAGLLT